MATTSTARGGRKTTASLGSSGRARSGDARPAVAVDAALLTLLENGDTATLAVLEIRGEDGRGWRLPGAFLNDREPLLDGVLRALRDGAGVTGASPRQLHVAEDPDRAGRGWVLSVAHVDVIAFEQVAGRLDSTRLAPADAPGRLPAGQGALVARAVADLRARYLTAPDPDHLLPESFTLRELRRVHEAVVGVDLQRDTFRRAMEPLLEPTGRVVLGGRGRPAELFARA